MKKQVKKASVSTELKQTSSLKTDKFPIVGIGASAGGLEALEQFFSNTPPNNNIAFVVIQHLDPHHKGMMAELLQRITQLKVYTVTDGMPVKPNSVYVIPPNKSMSILHDVLHLFEPIETHGLRLPIDFFFHSLALDRLDQSIGIVLSGMGSDGSLGLKSIKEQGGIVMVQKPESAKFDSMPRNAIKSVLVDVVASANELPEKLRNIHTSYKRTQHINELVEKDSSALDKIIILLRTQTGNDFTHYKTKTMYRRIERRMGIHQIGKIEWYMRFLQENPDEIEILFKELLIGVTDFFRDPEVWTYLQDNVLPKMFTEMDQGHVIRAWVPGCSTGEEAYSLAMIFKEALEKANLKKNLTLQIFATDLNAGAIDHARMGVYSETIREHVSANRLSRFFIEKNNEFRINTEIREMVVFATQNVIKDPPFTKLDLLSCRNMLIYMKTDLQKKILALFNYSLKTDGILVLGNAENIGDHTDSFATLEPKLHVYQSVGVQKSEELFSFPSSFSLTKKPIVENKKAAMIPDNIQLLTDNLLLQQFSPASVLVTPKGDILYITGNTGKYLSPAAGKASFNIFTMARQGLDNELPIAFRKAMRNYDKVVLEKIKIGTNGGSQLVNVTLQQIETPLALKGRILMVFEDVLTQVPAKAAIKKEKNEKLQLQTDFEQHLKRLNEELHTTREEMQTSQEELKSTNEELQSSNEELQSSNEELTTSKEEMRSLNEELHTVNAELQNKINDTARTNDDMNNLLNSSEIATLFLNREFKIRQYTNHATKIFKLRESDLGRPFTDLSSNLDYPNILADVKEVLRTLIFIEKTIRARNGTYYTVRVMPYRTLEDKIDGVVITFIDVTESKILEIKLLDTKKQHEELFDSMAEMVETIELIYDEHNKPIDFYIREMNQSFVMFLGKEKNQIINKKASTIIGVIEDYWLTSFAKVDKTGTPINFENYGAEFDKHYYVAAWKVSKNMVGVAFTDISARKRSENALKETRMILRSFIKKVSSVIIGLSSKGEIIEFNPEAEKVFECKSSEVLHKNYYDLFIPKERKVKVEQEMQQILEGDLPNKFVNRVKSATGKQLIIEWTAHKLLNENGELTGIITIGENIAKA